MTNSKLQTIVIEPIKPANAVMIWLHGLGSSGDDLAPLADMLKLDDSIHMRFIFPHAPMRPVSLNGGMPMTAWYDLEIHGHERSVVKGDLLASSEAVLDMIQGQISKGIPSDRIILAGFSQGGAVTYETLFRCSHQLAAAFPMSTYIGNPETIEQAQFKQTPIWVSHGTEDDVVPFELGQRAVGLLEVAGFTPSFNQYRMAHTVTPSQVKDLQRVINQVLG
ncbi:carboxylesterase [Oceaniserpentilla sp. 4NH20-0058]|uniref:alpha/beta hydrolase n=1 Tax=Oceaniserpentilla sp. 4NH20-0058 TaxID=3127660 RepID=UPI0031076904